MTIVDCKECKKEVSDQANICPHCGIKNPWLSFKQEGLIRSYYKHKNEEKEHARKYQAYISQMDKNLFLSLLNRSANKALQEKVDFHVSQANNHQSKAASVLKGIDSLLPLDEL